MICLKKTNPTKYPFGCHFFAQTDNCIIFNEHLNHTSCENKIVKNRMHVFSICFLAMQDIALDQSAIQASKQIAFESAEIRVTQHGSEIQLSGRQFIWIMKLMFNPNQCSNLDSFVILINSNFYSRSLTIFTMLLTWRIMRISGNK